MRDKAKLLTLIFVVTVVALTMAAPLADGQSAQAAAPAPVSASGPPVTANQVIDRFIQREAELVNTMQQYHPLVETYYQDLGPDPDLGEVPVFDRYYLGRLDFNDRYEERFYTGGLEKVGWKADGADQGKRRFLFLGNKGKKENDRGQDRAKKCAKQAPGQGREADSKAGATPFRLDFVPSGFSAMILPDHRGLNRESYSFEFLRREFLGDVRCLVFDVSPKDKSEGRFLGRIWVEDQDYNIVRFSGTFVQPPQGQVYFHMDSWRSNLQPGLWLPTVVYSQESDLVGTSVKTHTVQHFHFKAQTRLWAYDLKKTGTREEEFTQVIVDAPKTAVKDESESSMDMSPVASLRAWQREAEENVLDRLSRAALLAPPGPVDKVLQTVVNNLLITNNLDLQPEITCRVLLTTPLESFTVGHTIVVSRGLLDVLPDEASLAMVLAHELAHIANGEYLDTKYAYGDRHWFADQNTYREFRFGHDAASEAAADKRALELLRNSPYKDKLGTAGLFLKQLAKTGPSIPALTAAYMGDPIFTANGPRMAELMNAAPELDARSTNQIAALPLGGRIKLDAWSNQIEMMKTRSLALQSVHEKMPFEVAPAIPRLARITDLTEARAATENPREPLNKR